MCYVGRIRDMQNIHVNLWPWQYYKPEVVYALKSIIDT